MVENRLLETAAVALGGALGTLMRFGLNLGLHDPLVPYSTALENLTGALLLGCLTGYLTHAAGRSAWWLRTGVGVGFCGGYTTMSTFASDAFLTGLQGNPGVLAGYVAVSLVGGILLARVGLGLGEGLARREGGRP